MAKKEVQLVKGKMSAVTDGDTVEFRQHNHFTKDVEILHLTKYQLENVLHVMENRYLSPPLTKGVPSTEHIGTNQYPYLN